jgi:hypothetical protein
MAGNQRRMPQNAVGGGIQAGIRPEQLDQLRNNLASSVGKTYASGSPRGEAAGYTTSSPGWRQPAPAPMFPPAPPMTTGAIGGGGGAPVPTPRPDPIVTGAVPTPSPRPEGQGMAVGGAGAFIPPAIPPSTLSPLGTLTGVPPALVNPNEGTLGTNMPPALAGVPPALDMPPINNPALVGTPPALRAPPPSTFAARPDFPAPNLGDIAAMPEGASRARQGKKTPLAKKGGRVGRGQYGLRKEAATS